MYCIKLFYMNDTSILMNFKKNGTLLKTRCYVINLFFINQNTESAVFLYTQRSYLKMCLNSGL